MKSCHAGGWPGRAQAWPAGGLPDFLDAATGVVLPTNDCLPAQYFSPSRLEKKKRLNRAGGRGRQVLDASAKRGGVARGSVPRFPEI